MSSLVRLWFRQKDLANVNEELTAVRQHLERCERELERKKSQLEMYRKIGQLRTNNVCGCLNISSPYPLSNDASSDATKDEFAGLSDENKLKRIERYVSCCYSSKIRCFSVLRDCKGRSYRGFC